MRLKGKILIILTISMLIPVILISAAFFVVFRMRFHYNNEICLEQHHNASEVENSFRFLHGATESMYHELEQKLKEEKEELFKEDYLQQIAKQLKNKYTYLLMMDEQEIFYSGISSIDKNLKAFFSEFSSFHSRISGFYEDNEVQYLVRGIKEEKNENPIKLFLISDITEIDIETNRMIMELFYSLVISILLSGGMFGVWLNCSVIRPVNRLKEMTKCIVAGDLDTEITLDHKDEMGELYNDFDNMRIHVKSLLEQNLDNEKSMREIMVNISHDLRTPLTAIKGYTMGLVEGVASTPEKQEKYLNIIGIKAEEMNILIEELSAFAKMDMNYVPYHRKKVNLHNYIEKGIRTERTDFELQNAKILYSRNIKKSSCVFIDVDQFNKVMNNIISNAKKYRREGIPGILHIKTYDEGAWIRIDVEDNGKGIRNENLIRIFERFFREESSRNTKSGGSGLGLAIAKKIVENHGGKISAESELGVGTIIHIYLKKYEEQLHLLGGRNI